MKTPILKDKYTFFNPSLTNFIQTFRSDATKIKYEDQIGIYDRDTHS